MKMKILAVVVPIILIVIIGLVSLSMPVMEKYSYGTEVADLDEFYEVKNGEAALILQNEKLPEKALIRENRCYLDLDTVHSYLNEGFFEDCSIPGSALLYTDADGTWTAVPNEKKYDSVTGETVNTEYTVCFYEGELLYLAADYVREFTNFSFEIFDRHVQLYTEWEPYESMTVEKNTQIRTHGGIKSPILREVEKGEIVELLEEMENWSKVKTSDSFIGYIENKRMTHAGEVNMTPVTDARTSEYTTKMLDQKVCLGFHSIGGVGGNDTLQEMAAESVNMNVIAPTWFSLIDNFGNYRSFGTSDYVEKAHGMGYLVWGVVDNFNAAAELGYDIDETEVLSVTTQREYLISNLINEAVTLGLDGINVDFEGLNQSCGIYYVQFLRELGVACRKANLTLSIDNYVPFNFNDFYRLDIQGLVADYVLIMGYDEHYHGSGDPGSVASIDYVANGLERTLSMVPKEKVINALPLYTILWKTEGTAVSDQYITLNNLAAYVEQVGIKPEWDEVTCQNYAEWDSGVSHYQLWLEDGDSITAKLNVMNAKEIGGVGVWRLGYGTSEIWQLIGLYATN